MKRVKIEWKKPNPLFERWLEEWRKEAAQTNSDLQYHFSKALKSLKKYPLPLKSGKDCIILQHFGAKLCSMLDRKLEEHKKNVGFVNENEQYVCTKCHCEDQEDTRRRKSRNDQESSGKGNTDNHIDLLFEAIDILSWETEHYAALYALYNMTQDSLYSGSILESELLYNMHEMYGMSSKGSISTLFSHGLVSMTGSPIRYNLTDQGLSVAKNISRLTATDTNLIKTVGRLEDLRIQFCAIYLSQLDEIAQLKNVSQATSDTVSSNNRKSKSLPRSKSNPEIIPNVNDDEIILENDKLKRTNTQVVTSKKSSRRKDVAKNKSPDIDTNVNVNIIFEPNSFDIVLLVDTQETSGGKTKPEDDATIAELTDLEVLFEIRHLKVGDFAWVARHRQTREELVLPYIVERKRIDDLSSSIVDGRFHEQKFRLKQSGIENIIYVVENYDKSQRLTIPHSALMQASVNSLVQDGFSVKFTKNHRDSMFYLSCLSRIYTKLYKEKSLIGCKKENLDQGSISSRSVRLMKFEEFNKGASKQRTFQVSEMFVRQLLQIKGISVDKALAIVEKYPTPRVLVEAFNKSYCNPELLLANMQIGEKKRAINTGLSKAIYQLYTNTTLS